MYSRMHIPRLPAQELQKPARIPRDPAQRRYRTKHKDQLRIRSLPTIVGQQRALPISWLTNPALLSSSRVLLRGVWTEYTKMPGYRALTSSMKEDMPRELAVSPRPCLQGSNIHSCTLRNDKRGWTDHMTKGRGVPLGSTRGGGRVRIVCSSRCTGVALTSRPRMRSN